MITIQGRCDKEGYAEKAGQFLRITTPDSSVVLSLEDARALRAELGGYLSGDARKRANDERPEIQLYAGATPPAYWGAEHNHVVDRVLDAHAPVSRY